MTYSPAITDPWLIFGNGSPRYRSIHRLGYNADVDLAATEDVWAYGGTMTWQQTAATISVVSSSTNDDGNPTTGTGAHTVTIEGLDANLAEISETVTLNGTTPVVTSQSFLRLNLAYVATGGTYHGANAGGLTFTFSGSGNVCSFIPAGRGQTQKSHYTVPAGYTAYLRDLHLGVASGKTADLTLWRYQEADDATQPFQGSRRAVINIVGLEGEQEFTYGGQVVFPEKCDVWVTCTAGANDTGVSAEYTLILKANN